MLKFTRTLLLFLAMPSLLSVGMVQKDQKPGARVMLFLDWYKKNHQRLEQMNMVLHYTKDKGADGKNYEVDHITAEKYMSELKKSGFVHSKFAEKWRKHFKKCEEDFKSNPQNTGVPRGFETNFVMLTNDYVPELDNLHKAEIKSETIASNASATVMLKMSSDRVLRFELAKQNNMWLITDIAQ